ncbi:MAG TPA: hypothetical protein VGV67_14005 [Solirubrobacteraceae bacterium]|nr:hypothetical protein [Solirubrobacteraceae bacterium]
MTTFATPDTQRRLAELDARKRIAWTSYRDELRGLEGDDYDDAEAAAWDQLQATLGELEMQRAELLVPDRA